MFRSPSFFFRSHLGLARVCGPLLLTLYVVRALNPVARGQPRPVHGRRAQPQAAAPWPPTAWAGLPTVALHGGHAPQSPRSASHCPTFLNFPEARKPPGARRRAWTTASGCPPPPPSHPCPEPLRLGDRGSRGPVREGAPGGAALGVWGCKPPAWERPRRGGDRASEARRGAWTPPSGGLFTPKGRTTLRQQCVVSTLLVVARRRQRATTNGLHPKKRIQE